MREAGGEGTTPLPERGAEVTWFSRFPQGSLVVPGTGRMSRFPVPDPYRGGNQGTTLVPQIVQGGPGNLESVRAWIWRTWQQAHPGVRLI